MILVILEGPDGAGKSGAIRRLRGVFSQLGAVREVHFGAPPAGEKRRWLARYRDRLPRAGQVAIWDRSYYGRVVYDRSLFETAMERTGGAIKWHVVPMDDRGEGRFELLEVLRRELVD